ncbi:uncharacterized protein LOC127728128 [Mytilus californianus]|uniref:uncharacterized protein LOC127728128 n=1 Tax=Mytilus californianus TaxID=6549 RepID=UPI00224777F4|nr:uncharacterized protein LOC127728128 [Mytilus californianus]
MLAFQRIVRQINYSMEHVSPFICKVHLPGGFPYESFDNAAGKIKPRSLLMVIESSRVISFWPKKLESFLDMERISRSNLIYIATIQLQVSPSVYLLDTPKYPLTVTHSLVYIGNSSKRISSILSCPEVPKPYAQFDVHHVLVDPATRKPTALPLWWTAKYGSLKSEVVRPLQMDHLLRPDQCLKDEIIVHPLDCDVYEHTSWSNYGNFCYDTCCVFARKSLYKTINSQSLKNGLKSITVSFKKESLEFESLNIYSWDDILAPNKAYFEILNQNGETCCQASIEFFSYSPEEELRLETQATSIL